jgi:transcriptional regulator with XRE-family HTH domain
MENQELINLGKKIKSHRNKLSISQEFLAEKCGFDRTYINLLKLSNGLNISISELLV